MISGSVTGLMALTISQKHFKFSHNDFVASATGVCIFLFLPFLIAIREELATWRERVAVVTEEELTAAEPAELRERERPDIVESAANRDVQDQTGCWANMFNKPKRGEDYSILQALLSADMLILFVFTFCGLGSSLAAVDNLGQIGESLGYHPQTVSTFVSLVSIWNYFGRVFSGFASEKLISKWKVPRTAMMTFALVLPAIGDLIIALPFRGSVYIASVIVGFSYGIQITMLFVILSEIFGLKHYSTLFNCGQLASPLGSYVLNVKVVGKLYDKEALRQLAQKGLTRSMVSDLTCIGTQCYRTYFLVLTGVNLFGALVSLALVMITREYYSSDIYNKFRDRDKTEDNNGKQLA